MSISKNDLTVNHLTDSHFHPSSSDSNSQSPIICTSGGAIHLDGSRPAFVSKTPEDHVTS